MLRQKCRNVQAVAWAFVLGSAYIILPTDERIKGVVGMQFFIIIIIIIQNYLKTVSNRKLTFKAPFNIISTNVAKDIQVVYNHSKRIPSNCRCITLYVLIVMIYLSFKRWQEMLIICIDNFSRRPFQNTALSMRSYFIIKLVLGFSE